MPTYIIKAPNGKQLEVTGDAPPSEAELDAIFKAAGVGPAAPETPARGGISHPLTSVIAPELEAARTKLNAATAERPGDTQPVMARSRTGALYPSGINRGGVGAIARGVAAGAGNEVISQAEGATSPVGMVAAAVPGAIKAGQKVAQTVAETPNLQRAVQIGKAMATDPDAIGLASPRVAHGVNLARKIGPLYTKARDAVDAAAVTPAAAPAPAAVAGLSPQRVLNDLALAARRAGTKLTEAQEASAIELVNSGKSAGEAVAAVVPPTRSQAMGVLLKMATKSKVKLTAEETRAGLDMLAEGKQADNVLQSIVTSRELQKSSAFAGLPTPAEVKASVAQRNATGRWAPGKP